MLPEASGHVSGSLENHGDSFISSMQVHVGDWIDFIVWPRASQDCDGIYLVDMQMWEDDGLGRQHKEEEEGSISEVARLLGQSTSF